MRARLARQTVERDIAAASEVQAHMWPGSLPAIPGFDCAAASLPARGVGGDFTTVFRSVTARIGRLGAPARRRVRKRRRRWSGRLGGTGARPYRGHARAPRPRSLDGRGRSRRATRPPTARAMQRRCTGCSKLARRLTLVNAGHPAVLVLPPGCGDGAASRRHRAGAWLDRVGHVSIARCAARAGRAGPVTDGVYEALDQDDVEFGDEQLADLLTRQPRPNGGRALRGHPRGGTRAPWGAAGSG